MLLTWTVLCTDEPRLVSPWAPAGAVWSQAGPSSPGRAGPPAPDGRWWSVLATWPDLASAASGPPPVAGTGCWHVVLEPFAQHGDVVLDGGERPFDGVRPGPCPDGPVALLTVASAGADEGRAREFGRRFGHVARDVDRAPGHLLSLVQVPAGAPGPVVVLSVWQDLSAGLGWAYSSSPPHTSAVARQGEHRLVERSGSVRCAVLSSRGTLGGAPDPLAATAVDPTTDRGETRRTSGPGAVHPGPRS